MSNIAIKCILYAHVHYVTILIFYTITKCYGKQMTVALTMTVELNISCLSMEVFLLEIHVRYKNNRYLFDIHITLKGAFNFSCCPFKGEGYVVDDQFLL